MQIDPTIDQKILLNTEIGELSQVCSTNSYFYQLCSSHSFWKAYYEQAGLILLKEYVTPQEYIWDFSICKDIAEYAKAIITALPFPREGYPINESFLYFETSVNNVSDFNVPGVDYKKLAYEELKARHKNWGNVSDQFQRQIHYLSVRNNRQFDFDLQYSSDYGGPEFSVIIAYVYNPQKYRLSFFDSVGNDIVLNFYLSKEEIYTLLYTLLYRSYKLKWFRGSAQLD